jgi:hypothetical protein
MRRTSTTRWMRLAMTALALALAGCGETPVTGPTQPLSQGAGTAAPVLVSVSGGTGTFVPAPTQETVLAAGSLSLTGLTSSVSINGALGGRLTCGRFAVSVPAGAFAGTGTVTMRMSDSTVAVVDLGITPTTLNNFKTAVDLSYNPTGLGLTDPISIYWYDSNKKVWVDLVAKVDSKTGLPTVHLKHFSPYGAGKAGW